MVCIIVCNDRNIGTPDEVEDMLVDTALLRETVDCVRNYGLCEV